MTRRSYQGAEMTAGGIREAGNDEAGATKGLAMTVEGYREDSEG